MKVRQDMFTHSVRFQHLQNLRATLEAALGFSSTSRKGVELFSQVIAEYAMPIVGDIGFAAPAHFDIRHATEATVFNDPSSVCEYEDLESDACSDNEFGGKLEFKDDEKQEEKLAAINALTELLVPQYSETLKAQFQDLVDKKRTQPDEDHEQAEQGTTKRMKRSLSPEVGRSSM